MLTWDVPTGTAAEGEGTLRGGPSGRVSPKGPGLAGEPFLKLICILVKPTALDKGPTGITACGARAAELSRPRAKTAGPPKLRAKTAEPSRPRAKAAELSKLGASAEPKGRGHTLDRRVRP